jgi:hypothetical protein
VFCQAQAQAQARTKENEEQQEQRSPPAGRLRYHYYTDCSRTKREGGGAEEPYDVKAQHGEVPHRGPCRCLKRGDGPRVDRFEEDSRGLV